MLSCLDGERSLEPPNALFRPASSELGAACKSEYGRETSPADCTASRTAGESIDETICEEGGGRDPGALPDDGMVDKTSDRMIEETSDATVEGTSDGTVDGTSGRMVNEASDRTVDGPCASPDGETADRTSDETLDATIDDPSEGAGTAAGTSCKAFTEMFRESLDERIRGRYGRTV